MSSKRFTPTVILGGFIAILVTVQATAQDKEFGKAGVTEIAGSVSFASFTPVSNGETGDATTMFTLAPQIGYFVTDGFEIGFNPGVSLVPGLTVITPSGGDATTLLQLFATAAYNFHSDGSRVYPFIEVPFGYTSESSGEDARSGFSWGIRGGLKVVTVGHFLLTVDGRYLMLTLNPEGAEERSGINVFSFGVGFGGFF